MCCNLPQAQWLPWSPGWRCHACLLCRTFYCKPFIICLLYCWFCRYRTAVEDVPLGYYTLPLGVGRRVASGDDVTLVGWGQQVISRPALLCWARLSHRCSSNTPGITSFVMPVIPTRTVCSVRAWRWLSYVPPHAGTPGLVVAGERTCSLWQSV